MDFEAKGASNVLLHVHSVIIVLSVHLLLRSMLVKESTFIT